MLDGRIRRRSALAAAVALAVLPSSPAGAPVCAAPLADGSTGSSPGAASRARCLYDPADLPPPVAPGGRQANYLHTCGNKILDSRGREVRIFGVNWSGMEWDGGSPGGLGVRNWQEMLDQVAALGYNTIRIPFCNGTIADGRQISGINFQVNPDLEGLTGLELLDTLVGGARERGLKLILDRHGPTSNARLDLWYSPDVSEERWIADWRRLAARYYGDDTVIAFDLHNEPHGTATWGSGDRATDWRLASERAGRAILEENPYLLIFVEGIQYNGGDQFWWGGNLTGARAAPVRLPVPGRLVYSPHDYGPSVSWEGWFADPRFPANMPEVWDRHWGYLHVEGLAPVVMGEFGGWSFGTDTNGKWQRALLDYLRDRGIGALVWSLNPSWDTGGILGGDWQTVDQDKRRAYQPLLAAPLGVGPSGVFGRARSRPRVLFHPEASGDDPTSVAFSFRIFNDGPTSLDLSHAELRYWFRAGHPAMALPPASVDNATPGRGHATTDFVSIPNRYLDHYLRVTFADTPPIDPYRAGGSVTIRFQRTGMATATPEVNKTNKTYVLATTPATAPVSWHTNAAVVCLYLDGQLLWGDEP